jgi:hypothetical protein
MLTPIAIISILEYCTDIPEMSTWFLTLVCLSLPLSSLWAAAYIQHSKSTAHSSGKQGLIGGIYNNGESTSANSKKSRNQNLLSLVSSEKPRAYFDTPSTVTPKSLIAGGERDLFEGDVEIGGPPTM